MDPVPSAPSSTAPAELPLVFLPAVPVTQLSSLSAPPLSPQPLNSVSKPAQSSHSIRKQTPIKLSDSSFQSLPQRQPEHLLWTRCGSGWKRKGFWEETVNTMDGLPSFASGVGLFIPWCRD